MMQGAIALYEEALYEEALRGPGPALVLRTADGRALPLEISRWCEGPDTADEELLSCCGPSRTPTCTSRRSGGTRGACSPAPPADLT